MKRKLTAFLAVIGVVALVTVSQADAAESEIALVSCGCASASCDCGVAPGCGCESPACDGCCDGGACGVGGHGSFLKSCLGDCCLGDPWSLFGEHCGFSAGGWVQMGYHSKALPLFNSRPDEFQLHQAWLYAEKAVDGSCGLDLGGRVDYLYGTDSQDTQAFGIDNGHWDNSWDNGPDYGHALPQLYVEAAYGDWTVKAGKFFTIIGYEVVAAPDNFFYSHAYTMYNSEPFTHTGALASYQLTDCWTVFGGYVLGWDSGFEDNGDAWLGGSHFQLCEDIKISTGSSYGRIADNAGANERGYMGSIVADVTLTDDVQYIIQGDVLSTEDAVGQTVRETLGVNQYLIKTVNDCVSYGARFEWWKFDGDSRGYYGSGATPGFVAADDFNIFALTLGLNYKPHANVVVRPEVRFDWVDGSQNDLAQTDITLLENNDDSQTTFGVDTIFLF